MANIISKIQISGGQRLAETGFREDNSPSKKGLWFPGLDLVSSETVLKHFAKHVGVHISFFNIDHA